MINPNLLANFFPPCVQFPAVRRRQLLFTIVMRVTFVRLMDLKQHRHFCTICNFKDGLLPLLRIRNPLDPISIVISICDFLFHKVINLLLQYQLQNLLWSFHQHHVFKSSVPKFRLIINWLDQLMPSFTIFSCVGV